MSLPSVSDLYFILIILVPGFVTLSLIRHSAIFDRTLSDNETIYWSLFCSMIIFTTYLYGKTDVTFQQLSEEFIQYENISKIIVISLVYGLVFGYFVKIAFRRSIFRDDCWELCFKNASKNETWLSVYTNDGEEYQGQLHYNSGSIDPREFTIRHPHKIVRQEDQVIEKEWGEEILFIEDDIKRVVFHREL